MTTITSYPVLHQTPHSSKWEELGTSWALSDIVCQEVEPKKVYPKSYYEEVSFYKLMKERNPNSSLLQIQLKQNNPLLLCLSLFLRISQKVPQSLGQSKSIPVPCFQKCSDTDALVMLE